MKPIIYVPALILAATVGFGLAACANRPPLRTVKNVDLERYAGTWHEIARIPNSFQRSCAGDVTATYTPMEDGRIRVLNKCRTADGSFKEITGTAKPVPGSGNSRLKVTFFWPFSGDYWIVALDEENYNWALVGHPSRNYLWILARQPSLPPATYDQIVAEAIAHGFDATRIKKS